MYVSGTVTSGSQSPCHLCKFSSKKYLSSKPLDTIVCRGSRDCPTTPGRNVEPVPLCRRSVADGQRQLCGRHLWEAWGQTCHCVASALSLGPPGTPPCRGSQETNKLKKKTNGNIWLKLETSQAGWRWVVWLGPCEGRQAPCLLAPWDRRHSPGIKEGQ